MMKSTQVSVYFISDLRYHNFMKKIVRMVHIATIVEINPNIDEGKFEATIALDPGGSSPHDDGKPASASWYHSYGNGHHCTTIFASYRRPEWRKASPGCYQHPRSAIGEVIAVGEYHGEPGEWRLSKRGDAPKAPYERGF